MTISIWMRTLSYLRLSSHQKGQKRHSKVEPVLYENVHFTRVGIQEDHFSRSIGQRSIRQNRSDKDQSDKSIVQRPISNHTKSIGQRSIRQNQSGKENNLAKINRTKINPTRVRIIFNLPIKILVHCTSFKIHEFFFHNFFLTQYSKFDMLTYVCDGHLPFKCDNYDQMALLVETHVRVSCYK